MTMFKYLVAAIVAVGCAVATPAAKADFGIRVGLLTCDVAAGYGYLFGSRKALACYFNAIAVPDETYDGAIGKFGLDAGYTGGSRIVWAVFAPTLQLAPGALEGNYYGVTAELTPAVGLGANVLIGGFDRSINLQPISVQGQVGANIAVGLGALRLESPPPIVYKR